MTARLRTYTAELTKDVWKLEQLVPGGHRGDPESFLDEMFRARHGLLMVCTVSALSREVYARMVTITAFGPGPGQLLLQDAVDQFHHLSVMADSQKAYLQADTLDTVGRHAGRHAGRVGDAAGLGEAQGLVLAANVRGALELNS